MTFFNPWLNFSLGLLVIWLIIYYFFKRLRKEMRIMSLLTMPLGLTEPLFVPEYWSPPSLFDLATRTGFDMESLIFCFATGGIGAVIYEAIFKGKHKKAKEKHKLHPLAVLSPIILFVPLYFMTEMNPIYSSTIAMLIGGIIAIICRTDLTKKILIGGLIFGLMYFTFFFLFNIIYPGMVFEAWNLASISGILILGVPLEELLFAFSFGMLWSSIYEHVFKQHYF